MFQRRKQHHTKLITWTKKNHNMVQITIGVATILTIGIILSVIIPESVVARENVRQSNIIKKMIEIDDIAHQQDAMINEISGYNMDRDRMFHIKDNAYHKAQYRDEKFKAAMELNTLIKEQNIFLHEHIQENAFSKAAKEEFDRLQKELDELLQ